jgi:hypothetical protein
MNNNKIKTAIAAAVAGATILATAALPALAIGVNVSLTASSSVGTRGFHANIAANLTAKETQLVTRADTEIKNRINALNAIETRVNGMQKLSADEKSGLSASIQTQITAMSNLETQIAADQTSNNTSTLKADVQSITKAYRIYALVLPQGTIAAASDRIMTIAGAMTTLATTLQTRITAAQTAGADMSSSVSALADMNAKVTDANAQAQTAVTATASLQPDNGDATIMASNTAALKTARTNIQAAQKDLVAARTDALAIIKAIKASEKVNAHATTTTSQ